MFLKPSNTAGNERGLVFRRYTNLMDSNTLYKVFHTNYGGVTKDWRFDLETMNFIENDNPIEVSGTILVLNNTYYKYQNYYYRFTSGAWERTETAPSQYTDILPADVKTTIAKKYQKNEYYRVYRKSTNKRTRNGLTIKND